MKKVLLVLAVAAFAVACGNTGQQGAAQGQATGIHAAGCCSDGPTCCSEGLTQEQCAERKARLAGPQCCSEGLTQEQCAERKARAAQGCSRAAGEGCKRGDEGCGRS
ncbi:MAG: hypothetical protein FWC94_01845 [Bacteroidales bacterium]|nr:hypothetical protein [Bacteroidales bacterium]